MITSQVVTLTQQDDLIHAQSNSRGSVDLSEGGYNWQGELRLWDNRILTGWYAADDGAVNSKGTLYFVLHPNGGNAQGIWTGCSHDGNLLSGWGALARTEEEARGQILDLKRSRGIATLNDLETDTIGEDA